MRFPSTISAVALVLAGGAAMAAAPKPAPFVPAIAYTYMSGKSIDLRLANETGTAAILVHRASNITAFDLGPRDTRLIAYAHSNALWLRTWEVDSAGIVSVGPQMLVYQGSANIEAVDFSHDGTQIVFSVTAPSGSAAIRIVRLVPNGAPVVEKTIPMAFVTATRWNDDGSWIYFQGRGPADSSTQSKIHRIRPDGSGLEAFVAGAQSFGRFDASRPEANSGTSRFLLTVDAELRAYFESGNGQTWQALATQGSDGHYSCDNGRVLYRNSYQQRRPFYILDIASGTSTQWASDTNIHLTDWMPGCPSA